MKTFHNIVQGVLSGELGYGLMNGCKDPKATYCATVYDQLYLYECDKEFTLKTDVWGKIAELCKAKTLTTQSLTNLIQLRNSLKAEYQSNHPTLMNMMNHYAFFRVRAARYHNAIIKLLNFMNRIIDIQLAGCD
jgi:hypothetical protein